jgi:hypothetical protein
MKGSGFDGRSSPELRRVLNDAATQCILQKPFGDAEAGRERSEDRLKQVPNLSAGECVEMTGK